MTAAFLVYVALIPAVPLVGVDIYRRRKNKKRRNICFGLFVVQLFMSISYAVAWLGR